MIQIRKGGIYKQVEKKAYERKYKSLGFGVVEDKPKEDKPKKELPKKELPKK